MFAYITNFQMLLSYVEPSQIVRIINEAINLFDNITDKYDVFNMKTKMNASYMIIAGLHDRSNISLDKFKSFKVRIITHKREIRLSFLFWFSLAINNFY